MKRLLITSILAMSVIILIPQTASAHKTSKKACVRHAAKVASKAAKKHRRAVYKRKFAACQWWAFRHRGSHFRTRKVLTPRQVKRVICYYWRTRAGCRAALIVAYKESSLRTWAQNGQYCSIYQMGSGERASFGGNPCFHAGNNIRAAYRYYHGGGGSWSPWECKPWPDHCKSVPRWVTALP